MKSFNPRLIVLAISMTLFVLTGAICLGEDFHRGGTGNCQGCHTEPPALKGSDPSSTCLGCHQATAGLTLPKDHYVSTDIRTVALCVQLPPGGDFCWLKKDYRWSSAEGPAASNNQISRGERHGHNIVARDFGYNADTTHVLSPGGTYPAISLSCISCHDPHGNYRRFADGTIGSSGLLIVASGSYADSPNPDANGAVGTFRLLAGKGYQPKYDGGGNPFTADPPAAVAPSSYNRAETFADTRVAYGSGMSEWCANCHVEIHNDNYPNKNIHPSGNTARLSQEVVNYYNAYIYTGNLNNSPSSAYNSLVPYEMGTKDYSVLKAVADSSGSNRSGPQGGNANVMCLSCHRAHASGWDSMMRWNVLADSIVYDGRYPGIDNSSPLQIAQGRTEAETRKTFYDRTPESFAIFQRSLCNKCHVKD